MQFSMNTHFNCQKSFLLRAIQNSQTVLIQTIQFSISIHFVHTVKCQSNSKLNNSVYGKYSFNVKNWTILNNSVLH